MRKRIGILLVLAGMAFAVGLFTSFTLAAPTAYRADMPCQAEGILCPRPTATFTITPSPTASMTPSPSATFTPTPSVTPSRTPTHTPTATWTATPTSTPTATGTGTATPTGTPTPTSTGTVTVTPILTPTATKETGKHTGGSSATACTRINLDLGRNGRTGATVPGRFEMVEVGTGRLLAQWEAQANWTCSPWFYNLHLSFAGGSWVEVFFYPEGETARVKLEVLNPAPGTDYGWLAPGMCHAIELQFPEDWTGE